MFELKSLFIGIPNDLYVIVKYDEEVYKRRVFDIDIFTYDLNCLVEMASKNFLSVVSDGRIEVLQKSNDHIQLDLFYSNTEFVRLDIYSELPTYNFLSLKSSLFTFFLESRQVFISKIFGEISILNDEANSFFRYIEYLEYIESRSDKSKHLDFVNEYVKNNDSERIFSLFHYFVKLNSKVIVKKKKGYISFIIFKYKELGLRKFVKRSLMKLFKKDI
ncbi:hypothetical protein [Halobacteriovorax sp. CON-3]|uniref:hypothetical protein n=1 Tax=Halobacteriovorax sp. CON-3 TaxID=3157710 RepID=UPI00371CC100